MNFNRLLVLITKEGRQGATNFFFVYALIMPIAISLLVTLVFGDLFAGTPRLGIYAVEATPTVEQLLTVSNIESVQYSSESALREAVERGSLTAGVIFPQGFDSAVSAGEEPPLTVLYWREGLAKDINFINSTLAQVVGGVTAQDSTVVVEAVQLGTEVSLTWSERLLPIIVLMTIVLGGVLVPAASLVEEKQKRTLNALTITPASLLEVYMAKAFIGIVLSIIMGLIVLVLNDAFGGQPALLVTVLTMGAIASAVFGVILGSLVKDINILLAVIKAGGLVLFAPAIVTLIPSIPQWIAQVFPTYYMLNPVLEVSQDGASFGDIAGELAILAAIIGAMLFVLALVIERQQKQLALAS